MNAALTKDIYLTRAELAVLRPDREQRLNGVIGESACLRVDAEASDLSIMSEESEEGVSTA